mmetsp:Transcript_15675/g.35963  ORF Transcript_15675/g.35963 Transcript_15675/m.35963 type:complete len:266 (-) Transcript_15675:664-1461(-)
MSLRIEGLYEVLLVTGQSLEAVVALVATSMIAATGSASESGSSSPIAPAAISTTGFDSISASEATFVGAADGSILVAAGSDAGRGFCVTSVASVFASTASESPFAGGPVSLGEVSSACLGIASGDVSVATAAASAVISDVGSGLGVTSGVVSVIELFAGSGAVSVASSASASVGAADGSASVSDSAAAASDVVLFASVDVSPPASVGDGVDTLVSSAAFSSASVVGGGSGTMGLTQRFIWSTRSCPNTTMAAAFISSGRITSFRQ